MFVTHCRLNKLFFIGSLFLFIFLALPSVFAFGASNNVGLYQNILNVNITSYYPDNVSIIRNTVFANITFTNATIGTPALNVSNVTNVSFFFSNASNVWIIGSDITSANDTHFSVTNASVGLTDGNYTFGVIISNGTVGGSINSTANYLFPGTFAFDNLGPTVSFINTPGNQTNRTLVFNISAADRNINGTGVNVGLFGLHSCSVVVNGTTVATTNFTEFFGNTTYSFNGTIGFDGKNLQGTATCTDRAKDSSFTGNTGLTTQSGSFTIDTIAPLFENIQFKDAEGTSVTQFAFGNTVTIDCNPADLGLDLGTFTLGVKTPESSSFVNQTTPSTTAFSFTETQLLGTFTIVCSVKDYLGQYNSSNRSFTVVTNVDLDGGPFAIPGFKQPLGKKVIGEGALNPIEPTETGEARLIAETGGVVITIDGEDHSLVVQDIQETSMTLAVDATEVPFAVGDTKLFDLNSDGTDDVEVLLNMVYHKKADVVFTKVSLASTPATPDTTPTTDQQTITTPTDSTSEGKSSLPWVIVLVFIVVVILIFIVLRKMRNKSGGNDGSRISFRPRDLGSHRDQEQTMTQTLGSSQNPPLRP